MPRQRPCSITGTFMIEPIPRLKISSWSANAARNSSRFLAMNTSPRSSTFSPHGVPCLCLRPPTG